MSTTLAKGGQAMLDRKTLYAAVKNNDARLDGKFFVGVKTTGVYCRSVCTARTPKEKNCTFFATAAEAEQAGFRPCLLCRPELAPGVAPVDAKAALAHQAARRIEEHREGEETLAALAQALGYSDRHLRRAFEAEYHVSPVQYRQTSRLLLAKELLTDTDLPVTEVALAAGFQSLRRFNALFQSRYRMAPTDLRKRRRPLAAAAQRVTLELKYRPPYQWEALLAFLEPRAIPGVERIRDGAYSRTMGISAAGKRYTGSLRVTHRPERNALAVDLSQSLLPVLPQVLSRVKYFFDLYCEPETVREALSGMEVPFPVPFRPGLRLPGCFDPLELGVWAILRQRATMEEATALTGRLAKALGTPVEPDLEGLDRLFPTAGELFNLSEERLASLGVLPDHARTIRGLAQAIQEKRVDFDFPIDPEGESKALLALPGMGPWAAQYISMRTMGWTDAFPAADEDIQRALAPRSPAEIGALSKSWSPWRAYAAIHLWQREYIGGTLQ